ncbi:MAG: hypothetical protein GYA14_07425, partial [Ignavibacteria bacterium]|nr:hypothetical protein [Ignavibacteria bacterium]
MNVDHLKLKISFGVAFVSLSVFIFSIIILIISVGNYNYIFNVLGIDLELDLSQFKSIAYLLLYISIFMIFTASYFIISYLKRNSETLRIIYVFLIASIPLILILIKIEVL